LQEGHLAHKTLAAYPQQFSSGAGGEEAGRLKMQEK